MAPAERDAAAPRMVRPGESPRFLLLHREPQAYGLPLGVAAAVAPAGLLAFMLTRNPAFGLLLFGALLLIVRAATAYDPNFVRIVQLWRHTRLNARNVRRWGGLSLTPLPITRPTSRKQVPLDV